MRKIQFDGAAIPNPGSRGIGVILIDNDVIIKEISKKLDGVGTNNEAEYHALIEGLQQAIHLGWKDVCVQGDSRLVINQVTGLWSISAENLKKLNNVAKDLINNLNHVELKWIEREKNSKADYAASKALGFAEDPYHYKENAFKNKETKKVSEDIDFFCPKCKRECKFEWQTFKNGTSHIRQSCPVHGYIRYAPKSPKFLSKVGELHESDPIVIPLTCYACDKYVGCNLVEEGFADLCKLNKQ